jgi:hypothetical protein
MGTEHLLFAVGGVAWFEIYVNFVPSFRRSNIYPLQCDGNHFSRIDSLIMLFLAELVSILTQCWVRVSDDC